MITIATFFLLYIIIKWALIIGGVIIGLYIVTAIITAIVRSVQLSKMKSKAAEAEAEHGKGSIGAMVAREEVNAAKGDYGALLATSADRDAILQIIKWFKWVVANKEYYAIRETEPKAGDPNYAIVIKNKSGYNFKEFSCHATPEYKGKTLQKVWCSITGWKCGEEGELWFYSSASNIDRLNLDVNDIRYVIDYDVPKAEKKKHETGFEKPNTNSGNKEYKMASVVFSEDGKKYDYICDDMDINVGDHVVVDANGYEKTVRVLGVNIIKGNELTLPLDKYKHILKKADSVSSETSKEVNIQQDEAIDSEKKLQEALDTGDYDTIREMLDSFEIDEIDLDEAVLAEIQEESVISGENNYVDETINEPFICPECFEPYDGIYCENCGHSNDDIGYEEVNEDDKFFEGMAAMAIFDAMDKEDKGSVFGNDYDDYDEVDDF